MKIINKKIINSIEKYKNLSRAVKASFWFLISGFLQRGVSVLTTPIFTRLLNTQEYGEYSVFMSWIELLTTIVTLKLSTGVYMRGLIKHPDKRDEYSSSLLSLTTVLIGVFFGIYLIFNEFFNKLFGLSTFLMCCMFLMMLTGATFGFWSARQRVDFLYKKLVGLTILVCIAKPLVGIVAVILSRTNKVESRILGIIVVEFVAYAGIYFVQMRRGKKFFHKEYWLYALKFNIPLIPHYLSQTILNHSDRLMIDKIVGSSEAGIYSLAYSISTIMLLLNTALQNTYNPWVYAKIKLNKFEDIKGISSILLSIIAIGNFALVAVAPEAIRFFATKSYYEAIWIIPPVSIGVVFMFVYALFANVEMYFGKTSYMMFASIIGAIANIILNAIFIPIFGYMAAAYTTAVCYMIYALAHYIFMRNICNKKLNGARVYNIRSIVTILGLYIFFSGVMMYLYNYTYIRYFIVGIIILIVIIKRGKIAKIIGEIINLKKGDVK